MTASLWHSRAFIPGVAVGHGPASGCRWVQVTGTVVVMENELRLVLLGFSNTSRNPEGHGLVLSHQNPSNLNTSAFAT